jgi:poly(rC)-binding protein 2/3/4
LNNAAAAEEEEEDRFGEVQQVTVRMLVPTDQIGCVIGKGGQVIQNIRSETRAQIRITKDEHLPPLALSTDELLLVRVFLSYCSFCYCIILELIYLSSFV